ncbi:MAG: rhodanese-like domain-containing protein [Candidatus Brocadiaceae bacterium]
MEKKGYLRSIQVVVMLAGMTLFVNAITGVLIPKNIHAGEGNKKIQTEIKNISARQAKDLIDNDKDVYILDVRTKDEYHEAHLKDAHLIPIQELEQNINKIPRDKKVVVHCAAGKRSAKACELLKDKGLKELYNVEGGIRKWEAEGYPVEKP